MINSRNSNQRLILHSYPEYNCEANQVSASPVDHCDREGQNTVIELDQESETTIQPNSFTSDDNKSKSKIDMCNLKEWCDSISYEGGFMGKKVLL